MTDPFRLRIMETLVAELKARVLDLNAAVFFGRYHYGANDPLPMISLLEDPRIQEVDEADERRGSHQVQWKLLLQGFVEDDPDNPTRPAYLLSADLAAAAGAIRDTLLEDPDSVLYRHRKVNVVESIAIGAPIVRPPDEFSAKAYCWLPLTLNLVENPGSPFT